MSTLGGASRHLLWQLRKALGLFPFEQELSRSRIRASDGRCGVSALIHCQGMYDPDHMDLLKLVLRDGGCFLDVGANIGAYTLVAAEQPRARVVAIEPHPVTFGELEQNVALNGYRNVLLIPSAAGREDRRVFLSDGPVPAMNHLCDESGQDVIEVSSLRIESLCLAHGIVPDIVKIDVEGYEHDVLAGFGALLGGVKLFLVEQNGLADRRAGGDARVTDLLRGSGFDGPLHCNFEERLFRARHPADSHDSIFLAPALRDRLLSVDGFRFVAS